MSIVDIEETLHRLSFGAMTFDLGPRSRGQNVIFANISKLARDRDLISIIDILETIWAFVWCHDL